MRTYPRAHPVARAPRTLTHARVGRDMTRAWAGAASGDAAARGGMGLPRGDRHTGRARVAGRCSGASWAVLLRRACYAWPSAARAQSEPQGDAGLSGYLGRAERQRRRSGPDTGTHGLSRKSSGSGRHLSHRFRLHAHTLVSSAQQRYASLLLSPTALSLRLEPAPSLGTSVAAPCYFRYA